MRRINEADIIKEEITEIQRDFGIWLKKYSLSDILYSMWITLGSYIDNGLSSDERMQKGSQIGEVLDSLASAGSVANKNKV